MKRPYNPIEDGHISRKKMNEFLQAKQQRKKYILYDKVGDLWRIMACNTIWMSIYGGGITVWEGDIGGFVESEDNLSHDGNCWIYDTAKSVGHAIVKDNALIKHSSIVEQYAIVSGDAVLNDCTIVSGNATVCDKVVTNGNVFIVDDAVVCDEAKLNGAIYVCGNSCVCGRANVYTYKGDSKIIEGDMVVC